MVAQNRLEEAESYLTRALAIYEKTGGDGGGEIVNNLAQLYSAQRDLRKA